MDLDMSSCTPHTHTRYMWSLVDLEIELISAWHGIHNVPNLHRSFFARFVFGCDNLCPAVCQIAGRCWRLTTLCGKFISINELKFRFSRQKREHTINGYQSYFPFNRQHAQRARAHKPSISRRYGGNVQTHAQPQICVNHFIDADKKSNKNLLFSSLRLKRIS